MAVNAPAAHLNLTSGVHTVTGAQALAFVRAREGVGDGSDLERIQRQQFFLDAVLQKLKSTNLLSDPTRILHVVSDAAKSMTVDSGLDLSTLLKIANSMKSLNSSNVDFVSVPNGLYAPDPAKVEWTQPAADQLFQAIASERPCPRPPRDAKARRRPRPRRSAPPRSRCTCSTETGTGPRQHGGQRSQQRGLHRDRPGDVPGFGFTSSVIEYSSASQLPEVNTLKAAVSGATVKQDTAVPPGTITLIVGSNFNGLSSANPSASPSASSPSASASPSPSSSAGNLTKTYGGITGSTNICHDSAAFAP